jgi:hypothetical protein
MPSPRPRLDQSAAVFDGLRRFLSVWHIPRETGPTLLAVAAQRVQKGDEIAGVSLESETDKKPATAAASVAKPISRTLQRNPEKNSHHNTSNSAVSGNITHDDITCLELSPDSHHQSPPCTTVPNTRMAIAGVVDFVAEEEPACGSVVIGGHPCWKTNNSGDRC